jgi:hypothetical protein
VAVVSSAGEGLSRRERNTGLNTSALVIARPLARLGNPERLTIQGYRREGSRGLGSAPDHRTGVRLTHRSAWAAGGLSWLQAEGVAGDGARTPVATSAYAQLTPPMVPALAYLRHDRINERPDTENTDRETVFAGIGLELPTQREGRPPMRLVAGWSRTVTDALVRSLAGAQAEAELNAVYVQLDFRARATLDGVSLAPLPERPIP